MAVRLSISRHGSCPRGACSTRVSGGHTVTARLDGKRGTAYLRARPGPLRGIVVTPARASVRRGAPTRFAAHGRDVYGNPLGNVTREVVFSIEPDGSCAGAVCTARFGGVHRVTASVAVTSVDTGWSFQVCATTKAGPACWGSNAYGQLGLGHFLDRSHPSLLPGLAGARQVANGIYYGCVLTGAGGVKCWGFNQGGRLGDASTASSQVPVDVVGLSSGVTAIAASGNTCAIVHTALKCWGYNFLGPVGDGTFVDRWAPVGVVGLGSGVVSVSIGSEHACAATASGAAKCWGRNWEGQVGNGNFRESRVLTSSTVSGLGSGVRAVAVGAWHSCALTTAGGVKCWGDNQFGQLGSGTTTPSAVPIDVAGLTSGVTSISAGGADTCAVTTAGAAKCWGQNDVGELVNGTTLDSHVPVPVLGLTSGVESVSARGQTTCAVLRPGRLQCWGFAGMGQLAQPFPLTLSPRPLPVQVGATTTTVLRAR